MEIDVVVGECGVGIEDEGDVVDGCVGFVGEEVVGVLGEDEIVGYVDEECVEEDGVEEECVWMEVEEVW